MDMVFRAIAIYLILMVVFKIAGRRALLQMTSFDLILLLIISEATQQALLGNDFSVTGAAITIITLVVIDILFGLLKKYLPSAEAAIDGTPVILVDNGRLLEDKMRKADISCDDIMVSARNNHGIDKLSQIKFAILEQNGHISIIPLSQ
nr:YetF domain-containing protein [uncultured Enterobacter sp.]